MNETSGYEILHGAMLHGLSCGEVLLIVNPKSEGVELPAHCKDESSIRLDYSLNYPVPIENLEVDSRGVKALMSFRRVPFVTFVPWSAVIQILLPDVTEPLDPHVLMELASRPLSAAVAAERPRPQSRSVRDEKALKADAEMFEALQKVCQTPEEARAMFRVVK